MLARTTTLHSVSSEMHELPMVLHASPGPPTLHSVFAHFQHAPNHIRLRTTETPELHELLMILSFWGQGPEGQLASHPAGRPAGPDGFSFISQAGRLGRTVLFLFPGPAGWAGRFSFIFRAGRLGRTVFSLFPGPAGWAGRSFSAPGPKK